MHTLSLSNGGLKLHGVAFARRLAEIRVLTKARAVRPARADVDGRCGELDQDLWGSGYPLGADGLRLQDLHGTRSRCLISSGRYLKCNEQEPLGGRKESSTSHHTVVFLLCHRATDGRCALHR